MSGPGTVLAERYRLEEVLSGPDPVQGLLWRAVDVLAGEIPVVIRQVDQPTAQERLKRIWPRLQSLLHPQIPRCGELLELDGSVWTVRDWQEGTRLDRVQRQRSERQMLFGAAEVLLLLRRTLPVLVLMHARDLVHGDLNPHNLMFRQADGLPVLLDFGLVQIAGEAPLEGATAGYAPRAQGRQEPCSPWMDLHGLGVTALVLLSGRQPQELIDGDGQDWIWPEDLDLPDAFQTVLQRLLSEDPQERFDQAGDVLKLLEGVAIPEGTGPVVRSDRTVVLAPAAVADPQPQQESPIPQSRAQRREQGAEGRLWPVVMALALSAVVGTAIGWMLLSRGSNPVREVAPGTDGAGQGSTSSLPPSEVDGRQQLLSRLRALQVDRTWFLKLVDTSLLSRFPERGGRLPSDSLEDAPLRRVWNDLAEEWLARIEQLPPPMRSRLGQLKDEDWMQQQQELVKQGTHPRVVEQLVSAGARNLLPGDALGTKPAEPFRQLWIAAALQSLQGVQIESITAQTQQATNRSLRIPSAAARLISVTVPTGSALVLGINGTPLMQMTVFGSAGQLVAERGPLRVVTLPVSAGSPVQVLVTNEGVSSGLLTLSCRADRPRPAEPVAAPDQRPPQQTETPETLPAPVNDADVAPEPVKPEKKPTPETPPNLNEPNFDPME